jgi:Tol biopolymer transport system component
MLSSSSPEFSHDGTMIAFDAVPEVEALADAHIIVYAVEGPFKGMFKDLGCGNVPSWSPDDRQIVFSLNHSNPVGAKYGVWTMDSDGSNRKWLCEGFYARWSPDGKVICYHDYDQPAPGLAIRDVPSGKTRKLLGDKMEVKFGGANWSPDGRQLVFILIRAGKEHLATVDADGDPDSVRVLYSQQDRDRLLIGPPSWSPDGKQIVFAIQDSDMPDSKGRRWHHTYLYSISAEVPSSPVLLEGEKAGLINRSMMWSPDSQRIVFSSER